VQCICTYTGNGGVLSQLLALLDHFSHIPLREMRFLLNTVYVTIHIRSYRAFPPENVEVGENMQKIKPELC